MKKLSSSFSERAAEIDQNGSFPFENIQDLVQSGYTGLIVPARTVDSISPYWSLFNCKKQLLKVMELQH